MTTHRTIISVDVEGSGSRDGPHQNVLRKGLYEAMRTTFDRCGLPWGEERDRRDTGDGLLVVLPADIDNSRLVESLPHELAGQLRVHNAEHDHNGRIRLRVTLVGGEVGHDNDGLVGQPLILAERLLESTKLRTALRRSRGTLALIISDDFYRDVVKNAPAANPDIYRKVKVSVKETKTTAWVCLPDDFAVSGREHRVRPEPPRPAAPPNSLQDRISATAGPANLRRSHYDPSRAYFAVPQVCATSRATTRRLSRCAPNVGPDTRQ